MAEEAPTADPAETQPRSDAVRVVDDGDSNTITVLEDDGAAGASPPPLGNQPARQNQVEVVAERDPATGEVTLVEGKSTGGDGQVRVSGTDLVFEDQAAFDAFLAEVNAKEDAGVPFDQILGNDVNAIPVFENGTATGQTLGGIGLPGSPPVVVVGTEPAGDGTPRTLPDRPRDDPNGGADGAGPTPPGAAGEGDRGETRFPNPNLGNESPNGDGSNRVPRDGNGRFNRAGEAPTGGDGDVTAGATPANGANRQPGRDEDGNLLPGAEGHVDLDDFNRLNDRDGNGVNDGLENPVDLSGGPTAPGGANAGPGPDATPPAEGSGDFPDRNGNGVNDRFETFVPRETETVSVGTFPARQRPDGRRDEDGFRGDGERNQILDGLEDRLGLPVLENAPDVSGRGQPGRDEDGNRLPGAEGQVKLDDFLRINDRDGNGILDGIENPVDLRGDRDDEPRFEPPRIIPNPGIPAFEPQGPGQPFEPGGDGTPEIPGRGPAVRAGPTPPPARPGNLHDNGEVLGDGIAIDRDQQPGPGGQTIVPDGTLPAEPDRGGVVDPAADDAVAAGAVGLPNSESPVAADRRLSAGPADAVEDSDVPGDGAAVFSNPAATIHTPAAVVAVDTFETGTVPMVSAVEPAEAPRVASAITSEGLAGATGQAQTIGPDAEPCGPDGEPLVAGPAVAALAPVGAVLAATDVFDPETIGAAVTTAVAGATTEGGGNLLERIFDRVKDMLFDSGGGGAGSPVQLPGQQDDATAEISADAIARADQPLAPFEPDDLPASEEFPDDGP